MLPKLGESSLVEFGSAIPEGLHRCTTKTSNWYFKPQLFTSGEPIMDQFYPCDINQVEVVEDVEHTTINEKLEGSGVEEKEETIDESSTIGIGGKVKTEKKSCENTVSRKYYLYRLLQINAILIVVDPPQKSKRNGGKVEEWSDGPVEGRLA